MGCFDLFTVCIVSQDYRGLLAGVEEPVLTEKDKEINGSLQDIYCPLTWLFVYMLPDGICWDNCAKPILAYNNQSSGSSPKTTGSQRHASNLPQPGGLKYTFIQLVYVCCVIPLTDKYLQGNAVILMVNMCLNYIVSVFQAN